MKFLPVLGFCLLAASVLAEDANPAKVEGIDFTKRAVTDPLLKISTGAQFMPPNTDASLGAKRDHSHNPPVYKRLWSQTDVIMLEPFSREKPAQIDFSEITKNQKGILRLGVRNHPDGDFQLQIFKGGQLFKEEIIHSSRWERYQIPFDHEEVLIKNVANNWFCEFAFVDYSFSKAP